VSEDTSKVVGLRGAVPFGQLTVDPDVVEKLEELLQLARDGQLAGVAYVTIPTNRDITTGWAGKADTHDMVAGISLLQHRFMVAATEGDDE
jgi:hypothetical protein